MPSAQPYQIEKLLSSEELAELERYCAERRRTTDDVHEWMLARGYTLARSSCGTWLAKFRSLQAAEAMRASSSVAAALVDAARESGSVGVHDAAALQLGHAVVEKLTEMQAGGEVEAADIGQLALALHRMTSAKRNIEHVRQQIREQLKAEQAAALDEAEKTAKSGVDGITVVNTMRSLLGIASLPPADPPHAVGVAEPVGTKTGTPMASATGTQSKTENLAAGGGIIPTASRGSEGGAA